MKIQSYFLSLLLISACTNMHVAKQKNGWVENTLAEMTIEEKLGQMIVPSYSPRFYNQNNTEFKWLINLVKNYHIGGAMFFKGMPYEIARSIERLQVEAKIPLLIMADVEWGLEMRTRQATHFLPNMAIGATSSEEYAYDMGAITAEESKAIGVHMGFAPVLDINSNPDNVIINTRSFSEDPQEVARLGTAFIRGMQEHGVYATAKHFPGHGDTETDSHLDLPLISGSDERIHKVELVPFKAAIEAGVKAIMTAHITFDAIPQMQGRPATLDPYLIQEVLRKELAFKGLVISDAMGMGGIAKNYWSGEAAVSAINAGVDMLLMIPNFEATFKFVLRAIKEGRISIARIDDAVIRILNAKQDLGLTEKPTLNYANLEAVISKLQNLNKAEEIANASMTLLRGESILPLQAEKLDTVLVVTITDKTNNLESSNLLEREIRRRIPQVIAAQIDPRSSKQELERIINKADSVKAIITGVFVNWSSFKGSISLPDTTVKLLRDFFKLKTPMAVASFGSPYILQQLPDVPSFLCAYDKHPLAIRAATKAIFGEIPVQAKSPVSIPGFYEAGHGIEKAARKMQFVEAIEDSLFHEAYQVLENAISDSVFPGAQIAIVKNGALIASRGFGHQTYAQDSPGIDTETIYDLASITKVAATTLIAMKLWEQGELLLDHPVKNYLPKFQGGLKDSVTVRHLLTHSSGAHWWTDLWNKAENKEEALNYIYQLDLDYAPGDSMIYSDLGLILLGEIIETVAGKKLDQLAKNFIYSQMGMQNTMFNPPGNLLGNIAPTEIGGSMNRGLIHGDVHDENAHFFKGVSAHAGLFSRAEELAALSQMLLNGGIYQHHRFLSPETIRIWTERQKIPEGSIRALGWVTPADSNSSAGDYFSKNTFGHTGFTGTSIWMDPDRDISVILLTNRVHPTRERGGMHKVRRAFHNAVMQALLRDEGQE